MTPQRARRWALAWLIAAFVALAARWVLDVTGHWAWGSLLVGAAPLCLIMSAWHSGWRHGHSTATKDGKR